MRGFSGIEIKGRCFPNRTELRFFERKDDSSQNGRVTTAPKCFRQAIVYGENGSGKSTIAAAIKEFLLGNEQLNKSFEAKFIGIDTVTPEKIHIFDEKYISDHVTLMGNGLGEIVMQKRLSPEIESRISAHKDLISEIRKEIEVKNKEEDNFRQSLDAAQAVLSSKLEGNCNWAGREKDINNIGVPKDKMQTGNSRVSPILESIIQVDINGITESGVKSNYEKQFSELEAVSQIPQKIKTFHIPEIKDPLLAAMATAFKLFGIEIGKIDISGIAQDIIDNIRKKPKFYEDAKEIFSNISTTSCPYCLREIEKDEKNKIVQLISSILDKTYEEHIAALKRVLAEIDLSKCSPDFSDYTRLFENEINVIKKTIESLDISIDEIKTLIQSKINDPFIPIFLPKGKGSAPIIEEKILQIFSDLNSNVASLNAHIVEKNEQIDSVSKMKVSLSLLNKQLAKFEARAAIDDLNLARKRLKVVQDSLRISRNQLDTEEKTVLALSAQAQGKEVAIGLINKYLSDIFFDTKRITLTAGEGCYFIHSNEKKLSRTDQLSQGERNIIALAVFFATVNKGKSEDDFFNQDNWYIFDDPISSLDHANKLGIYVFMSRMFETILRKSNSNILILTHNLDVASQLQKAFIHLPVCDDESAAKPLVHQLKNRGLQKFDLNNCNEYTFALREIYTFACIPSISADTSFAGIGNLLRRVLEAYMTFNYSTGIYNVQASEIWDSVKNDKLKSYYSSHAGHLILNAFSHMKDSIQHGSGLFPPFSAQELQNASRDILVFLHAINPLHLKAHVENLDIPQMNSWTDERTR